MAHYAILNKDNIVINVIVGKDENDPDTDWELYYKNLAIEMYGDIEDDYYRPVDCKRTSYNTKGGVHYDPETGVPSEDQSKAFRKNYAGVGRKYDPERDAFIPNCIYDDWVLDEETCTWKPPKK